MSKLFPTSVVGSMPRPQYIQDLLNLKLNGNYAEDKYQNKINTAIKFIVQLQESVGLDEVSDGEWRRLSYIGVIADLLNGFKRTLKDGLWWHTVTQKVSFKRKNLFADEARFVIDNTNHKVKVALPSPFLIGARMWNESESKSAYETREEFMRELVPYLRESITELSKIGASFVQIDDPNLCLFVDPAYRNRFENPDKECELGVNLINDMIKGISGPEVGIHLCRSTGTRNRIRTKNKAEGFVGKGGYEFILPYLKKLKVDRYVMEFAHPDAGDVLILQNLPNNAKICLGCVDVSVGVIDKAETIVERVEKALQYVEKERLVLNPDCGFAPGSQANVSIDEAYVKLKEMTKAAELLRKKYE